MDEDEELYREMNEEDPFYMGDSTNDDNDDDYKKPSKPVRTPHSKKASPENKFSMKWSIFGCLSWLILIATIIVCSFLDIE